MTDRMDAENTSAEHEEQRLKALYSYRILDTPRESRFDDLTSTIADLLNVRYAKMGFFDQHRVWYKSTYGFNTDEGAITGTIAKLLMETPQDILVVPNLHTDPRITSSTALIEDPNIKAAACVPIITSEGFLIGMLCVFDTLERDFSPEERSALIRVARQVVELLESRREADILQETLRAQQDELRIKSTSDRIARTLVNSVNTKKDLHTVMDKFNQSVINEFGWWGGQTWYEQEDELIASDWILSTSSPSSLTGLNKNSGHPIPLPTNAECGLNRYDVSSVIQLDVADLAWHPLIKKLEQAGAREFVMINVSGPEKLALRLLFILPNSRSYTGTPKKVLETLRSLLPQVVRRARSSEELAYRATHDSLTGLVNRRGLEELYPQSLSQLGSAVSRTVFFFDLDKFKEINDQFGHAVGDEYLIEISKRLIESSRPVDCIARIGGDEFVIVAQGFDNQESLEAAANRFLENLGRGFVTLEKIHINPRVSMGIAQWRPHELLNAAIAHADARMYDAKAKGGHQAVIDFPNLEARFESKVQVVPELHALNIKQITDLKDHNTVGYFVSLTPPIYHAPRVMQDTAQYVDQVITDSEAQKSRETTLIIEVPGFKRSDRANIESLFDALINIHGYSQISFAFDTRTGNLDSSNFARELVASGLVSVALGNFGAGNNEINLIADLTPTHLIVSQQLLCDESEKNTTTIQLLVAISKSVETPLVIFEGSHQLCMPVLSQACSSMMINEMDLGKDSK